MVSSYLRTNPCLGIHISVDDECFYLYTVIANVTITYVQGKARDLQVPEYLDSCIVQGFSAFAFVFFCSTV